MSDWVSKGRLVDNKVGNKVGVKHAPACGAAVVCIWYIGGEGVVWLEWLSREGI